MQECERTGFSNQHTNFLFYPKITAAYEANKESCQRVGIRVNNMVENSGLKRLPPKTAGSSLFYLPEVISDFKYESALRRRVEVARPSDNRCSKGRY
jgi:hypothetical protein